MNEATETLPAAGLDYKATVFLPRTRFPMRAGLPKKEPEIAAEWDRRDLYACLRRQSAGRTKYVLHDGPPYANGHIHIGTALNKILKDIVVRAYQMLGYDSVYVPGWDCHGLPIEWKIEEQYRADGTDKDAVPILELRRQCRDFAAHWVGVHTDEFKRLGVVGDWQAPYLTMTNAGEAQIVREIHKFLTNGGLYRGLKPVMWSVVEKTALAEAEVEYHDHVSDAIHVRFPIAHGPEGGAVALDGAAVVIWTTTPWTIPSNRAIAYAPDLAYVGLQVDAVGDGATVAVGDRLLVAAELVADLCERAGITGHRIWWRGTGADLAGVICRHPLHGQGYDFDVPLLAGDFVTAEQGTGFVHIAPSHGEDDYDLGVAHGLEMTENVTGDGVFAAHVPLFAGAVIYDQAGKKGNANRMVVDALRADGDLVARAPYTHSYPHSWRSKAPVIFRATPQWFISMDTNALRRTALAALADTRFVPAAGYTRLSSMIEHRPDWCISRQRAWGVPIAIFVDKATGEPLRDPAVLDRIAAAFEAEGSDAWFAHDAATFLGDGYDPADYEQVVDIVDVWFESGSTHAFVLEPRPELTWPADLYLEGSDQHRGWFHSSLLESCGTRGRAPYRAVLTHGFVLDEQGRKMSKSLGNTVVPQDVCDQNGADILRLWVAGSDYCEDLRIGPEILKSHVDSYRRLRNTLRYLLGALDGFAAEERIDAAEMPQLERWVLHRLWEMDRLIRQGVRDFDFTASIVAIHTFCAVDLSAFYFDVRKDSLYCDRPDSVRRRSVRTVMDILFDCLTAWLAPVTCFTAEEAWWTRHGDDAPSVHERTFPDVPETWRDDALGARWAAIREARRVVTGAIELKRVDKVIRGSLEAHPRLYVDPANQGAVLTAIDALAPPGEVDAAMADVCITSQLALVREAPPADAFTLAELPGIGAVIDLAQGRKCERSWKILPTVGSDPRHPTLTPRDADAVEHWLQHHAGAGAR